MGLLVAGGGSLNLNEVLYLGKVVFSCVQINNITISYIPSTIENDWPQWCSKGGRRGLSGRQKLTSMIVYDNSRFYGKNLII